MIESKQDNRNVYDNWRIITDIDFVTMFIKTWFSFVATLRALYPNSAQPYYKSTGDSPYLSRYKKDFAEKYYFLLKYSDIEAELKSTYRRGYKLICDKYPRFLFVDFHSINSRYKESYSEQYTSPGGYKGDLRLVIRTSKEGTAKVDLICSDKHFLTKTGECNSVASVCVDVEEILNTIIQTVEEGQLDITETILHTSFYQLFFDAALYDLVNILEKKKSTFPDKGHKQIKKVYYLMQTFCIRGLDAFKERCLNKCVTNEHKLLIQIPASEYANNSGTLSSDDEQSAYLWFIGFAYRLRNALFHEIIDPLDVSWQQLFKHAYFVLKHIVEANNGRLQMLDLLKRYAPLIVESDFRKAPPQEIPFSEDWQTSFTTKKVEVLSFADYNAKVYVEMIIRCKGIDYLVKCNVRFNNLLNSNTVKNVRITKIDSGQLEETT